MLSDEDKKIINDLVKEEGMNEGREYRYQADWSIGTRMFHVRCDDWEEFIKATHNMESMLPQRESFPDDSGPMATPTDKVVPKGPMCAVHHVEMTYHPAGVSRAGRPYKEFYSCGIKTDGTFCNYRPKE